MSIENEIKKAQKRVEELKRRKLNQKKTTAFQFFKSNDIEMLLDSPEKLQEFTKEIQSVIEKIQTVSGDKKTTKEIAAEGGNDE